MLWDLIMSMDFGGDAGQFTGKGFESFEGFIGSESNLD